MIGRVGSLVGVVALATATVVAVQQRPLPAVPAPAELRLPISAAVPATVCPGPETLLVPDGATAQTPTGPVVLGAVVVGQGAGGTLARLGGTGDPLTVGRSAGVAIGSSALTSAGAVRLEAARGTGGTGVASAVQATLGRSGDLRGLAATTCGQAVADAWLVGSGTVAGERSRLLLSNPTSASATVDVTVYGPAGVVAAPSAQGVVVPSGGSVALLLDALAPDVASLGLHVQARTGRVVATVHDTLVRGLVPGGVDDVAPAAAPATTQVLPGVVVAAPGTLTVRVVAPGDTDAVVRVALLGPDGAVDLPSAVATVPAGATKDVPVTGAPDGTYTAVVTADAPVVAAARSSVTVDGGELAGTAQAVGKTVPPSEFAWSASAQPLRGSVALAVPPLAGADGVSAPAAALVVAAPDGQAVVGLREVDAYGTVGPQRTLTLDGGHSVVEALTAGTSAVLLTPPGEPGTGGPAYAALRLTTSDKAGPLLAVAPLLPGPAPLGAPPVAVEDRSIG